MARTKNEKKKKLPKTNKTDKKPHYVLDVHDSTISSKDLFGKGEK